MQQINAPLTSVAVPTLSRLQNQPDRFRAYFRRGVLLAVTGGMPAVAFLCVDAHEAVLTVLGTQWTEAVPFFRALAPAAFLSTTSVANGWVFIALGQTDRQFKWGIFASAVTVIGFCIGLYWGAIGVAWAFSVSVVLLRIPSIVYCFRGTPLGFVDFVAATWRPAIASVAAGAVLYWLERFVPWQPNLYVKLVVDFVAYAGTYTILWAALPGGRVAVRQLATIAQDLKPDPGAIAERS